MMQIVSISQMIKDIDKYLTNKDKTKLLEICDKFEIILSALPTEGNQHDSDTIDNLYLVQEITLKLFERTFGEKTTLDQENTENMNKKIFPGGWFTELVEFGTSSKQTINIIGNQIDYLSTLSRSAQRLIILINDKLINRQFVYLPAMKINMFPKKLYFNFSTEYEMIATINYDDYYDYKNMFENEFEINNENDSQIRLYPFEYYYVCLIRYPTKEDVFTPNLPQRHTKDSKTDAGYILKTTGPYYWLIGCPYLCTLQHTVETLFPINHNIMISENKKQLLFIQLVILFWIENNTGSVIKKNVNGEINKVLATKVPIREFDHIFNTWSIGTLQGIYLLLLQLMKNPSSKLYIDIMRQPLFDMLRTIFSKGKSYIINNMPAFTVAIEIWLLLCQPWNIEHFIDKRKPNVDYSDIWRNYVCSNIHFYTILLSIFLSVDLPNNNNNMFYLQHSFFDVIDLFNHALLNKTIKYFVHLFQNKIDYNNDEQYKTLDVVQIENLKDRDSIDFNNMVEQHQNLYPDITLYDWKNTGLPNGVPIDYGILSVKDYGSEFVSTLVKSIEFVIRRNDELFNKQNKLIMLFSLFISQIYIFGLKIFYSIQNCFTQKKIVFEKSSILQQRTISEMEEYLINLFITDNKSIKNKALLEQIIDKLCDLVDIKRLSTDTDIESCGNYNEKSAWLPGKIIKDHKDGSFDIEFSDKKHGKEKNVKKKFVRVLSYLPKSLEEDDSINKDDRDRETGKLTKIGIENVIYGKTSRKFDKSYIDLADSLDIESKPYKTNEVEFLVDFLIKISRKLNNYFELPKDKYAANFKIFNTIELRFSYSNFRFNLRPLAMYRNIIVLILLSLVLYIFLKDFYIVHSLLVIIRSIFFLLICFCLAFPKYLF